VDEPDHRTSQDEWTCGKGLAHHAAVPEKIAEFVAALASVLRTHLPTIDTEQPEGRAEWAAYDELATSYMDLADELARTAGRMKGYSSLAAAPHHDEALSDPVLKDVFARFVEVEDGLAELLRRSADENKEMLHGFD
jgi:predicted glycosyl hydrolase (DUF1957 family)